MAEPPKRGRPSLYKPEYCALLIEHCSKGLSFEAFAGLLGVAVDTIQEWSNAHKDFSVAKNIASAKCRIFWERLGIRIAAGQLKNANAAVYIFNMKNRFKWRDRWDSEDSENDGEPLIVKRADGGVVIKMQKGKKGA
jgi:hypothetical protein